MRTHRRIYEDDFREFVQAVIDGEHLEGAALGVARQVVARGVESLTARQRIVFDRFVIVDFTLDECSRAGCEIPWCEMYLAVQMFDGMCGWCAHMHAKAEAA